MKDFSFFLMVCRDLRDPIKADFTENTTENANFHDFNTFVFLTTSSLMCGNCLYQSVAS